MKGADLAAVQKIMRHQDPRITTEVYGHLQTTYLAGKIERLSFGPEPADLSGGGRPSRTADEQQSRLAAGGASEPPSPADSATLRLAAPFTTRLHVPNEHVERLLRDGHLPVRGAGTEARVPIEEALAFKERRDRECRDGLRELSRLTQALGAYDSD
jgi:hypothetical protein